jgi:chemotaxis protein CheX
MTAPTISLDSDALYSITTDIWTAYLNLSLAEPLTRIDSAGPLTVMASISVTGAWDGHVVVSSSREAAVGVAAAMLCMEMDEVSDADILDAAGELVNVMGGNIKSLLPQPCHLSLPITSDSGRHVRYPGTREICSLTVIWQGEPIQISVKQIELT